MPAHYEQWLNLAVRWLHVIAGIAWIGASFYFNWLNSAVAAPERPEPGVAGEVWSVHGGGFYRTVKYGVAPERLPGTLHWFIWEAYTTWISGFALLILVYYLQPEAYLVNAGSGINAAAAVAIGVAAPVGAWVVYHAMCLSTLSKNPALFGLIGFPLLVAGAWALTQVFAARAAYIHVGSMLGTIMAANVLMVIIPSQRRMVRAMQAGGEPDAAQGKQAALRSLHNNYFTLPVVFTMISSHYPMTYGHAWSWVILIGLTVIGAGTRHYFNLMHQGRREAWVLPTAALGMIVLAFVTQPKTVAAPVEGDAGVFGVVRVVIAQRCAECHSSKPTNSGFATAPQGVVLDTPEQIQAQAARINAVAVATRTMPPGNLTGMTGEERALLGRWIAAGARIP